LGGESGREPQLEKRGAKVRKKITFAKKGLLSLGIS